MREKDKFNMGVGGTAGLRKEARPSESRLSCKREDSLAKEKKAFVFISLHMSRSRVSSQPVLSGPIRLRRTHYSLSASFPGRDPAGPIIRLAGAVCANHGQISQGGPGRSWVDSESRRGWGTHSAAKAEVRSSVRTPLVF